VFGKHLKSSHNKETLNQLQERKKRREKKSKFSKVKQEKKLGTKKD